MIPADLARIKEGFEHIKEHWDELFLRVQNFYATDIEQSQNFISELLKFHIKTLDEESILLHDISRNIENIGREMSSAKKFLDVGTLASQKKELEKMRDAIHDYDAIMPKYSREYIETLPGLNRGVYKETYEILGIVRQTRDFIAQNEPKDIGEIQKTISALVGDLNSIINSGEFGFVVSKMNAAREDISRFILITHKYTQTHPEVMGYNKELIKVWNSLVDILRRRFVIVYSEMAPLGRKENVNVMRGLILS